MLFLFREKWYNICRKKLGGVKNVCEKFKVFERKNHMEQLDLAKELGRKSASSISEWEKGGSWLYQLCINYKCHSNVTI